MILKRFEGVGGAGPPLIIVEILHFLINFNENPGNC